MTLILRSKNDPHSRRIMTGVIFLRRIMTPGHYSTGVSMRRYTGSQVFLSELRFSTWNWFFSNVLIFITFVESIVPIEKRIFCDIFPEFLKKTYMYLKHFRRG